MSGVLGIHHVSSIAGDPQRNVDFYAGVLGLRLVKRTVNFDDPYTYHLYYGDESGTPGGIMTFFPWPDARRGRQGPPQIAVTSFSVLPSALGFWIERLLRHGVAHEPPTRRTLGAGVESVLAFRDPDGLLLEIVAHPGAEARRGWDGAAGIDPDDAIRGFHAVTLWVESGDATERVLVDTLGFRPLGELESTRRFEAGGGGPSTWVDVRAVGGFVRGVGGVGTVHHVAFRAPGDAAQLELRGRVLDAGLQATEPIDRRYFRSVYFHEPAGILFEVATEDPGFTVDEPLDRLGEALRLPPWLEPSRDQIEGVLPELHLQRPGDTSAFDAWADPGDDHGDGEPS